MTYTLDIRPAAEQDMADAKKWYNEKEAGLGDEFLTAAHSTLTDIVAMPELYAVVRRGVRQCKMKRFQYVVSYRIVGERVEVLAVLHGRRDPRVWKRRI